MRLLIHDASVLIDLLDAGLIDEAFALPYAMETTDFILNEITDSGQLEVIHGCIARKKLRILKTEAAEMAHIAAINADSPGLSIADCSVIHHAERHSGWVISGDKLLRESARSRNLTVHGTLWILEELVSRGTLSPAQAHTALITLRSLDSRLPQHECERLLSQWKP